MAPSLALVLMCSRYAPSSSETTHVGRDLTLNKVFIEVLVCNSLGDPGLSGRQALSLVHQVQYSCVPWTT